MQKMFENTILVLSAVALAVLGCWFCWRFHMEWIRDDPHYYFVRQIIANMIGIMLFLGAWKIGWKRWMKCVPWLFICWVGLCILALNCRPVRGVHRWVTFGPVTLNVQTAFWPIGALLAGWLCLKRRVKPWMIYTALACLAVMVLASVFLNVDRVERLMLVWHGRNGPGLGSFMQKQMRMAFEVAKWFGCSGRSLCYLPDPHTKAVVAGVALLLGKWAVVCAVALMGLLGFSLAGIWRRTKDQSSRMYILLFGGILMTSAVWSYMQSLWLVPTFGCTFSLLGYGVSDVVFTWLGLGIAVAAGRESGSSIPSGGYEWRHLGFAVALVVVLISALAWSPVPEGERFSVPMPKAHELGKFGKQPERGTILSADGSTLARSVGEWQVCVDPLAARLGDGNLAIRSIRELSEGLGVTMEEAVMAYSRETRCAMLLEKVDDEKLEWCRTRRRMQRFGLILRFVQRREYPLGPEAAHITGCCNFGANGKEPLSGACGLEYTCGKVLSGHYGKTDPDKNIEENLKTGKPIDGGTVRTTICTPIQEAMAKALKESSMSNHVESAWAIAVKIPKGEIVATCSWPMFDPNARKRTASDTAAFANGAVQMLHEPGGLMKPLIYAMAVDAGAVKDGEVTDFGNATFTNLCHTLGATVVWRGMMAFRVGKKLGAGMLYGEEAGFVAATNRWDSITRRCFGIGQGLAMTGVQLAQAYATLANGGIMVTPHLVESVTDCRGKIVWAYEEPSLEQIVSMRAADAVKKLLLSQTNSGDRLSGIPFAGKSSVFAISQDAHYSQTAFDMLYAGYFPVERPEYAVVVGIRNPKREHTVETVVAPLFERIVETIAMEKM